MQPFLCRTLGALLAVSMAGLVQAQAEEAGESEPAPVENREENVAYPPYPSEGSLLGFDAGAASGNRFFIDKTSLSVGADGIVRFVLVIRSPNGVDNVSFEGLRCSTLERRLYATGRADRTWSRSRNDKWMRISGSTLSLPHRALARQYLCDHGLPIGSAAEGVEAIRRGGPPGWLGS